MTQRRVYGGMYALIRPKSTVQNIGRSSLARFLGTWENFSKMGRLRFLGTRENYSKMAHDFSSALYGLMNGNYLLIATIVFVVVLSFFLPDITQKLQATQELKNVQKVLNKMSNEVKQAEVACLTVADEICCLHCNMHDDTTETSKDLQNLSVCTSHIMRTTQSEPAQINKKISFFRRIFCSNRNTSHKEIAIMSYVYTDSFNAQDKAITSSV